MGILENSSVLDKNGTWFLTCAGTNEMFTANCYSNGSWSHIPCEGSGKNIEYHYDQESYSIFVILQL